MSGVYTNIAKRRAEQNNSPILPSQMSQGVPPIPTLADREPTNRTSELKMSTKPQTHFSETKSATGVPFERPEKYTTHLEPSLIKKLKIYATERDMKDYQVVKNALLLYFEKNK